jgi:NAD(P)-dependent dehydrogenase (short-subunit alcohol dehydrogenase family)
LSAILTPFEEIHMARIAYRTALIVGAGSGISASVARALVAAGLQVGLAARNTDKLAALVTQTGTRAFACDASDPADVVRLFNEADTQLGEPDVVIFNASARARGPLAELDPQEVHKALATSAFGAFLVTQQAAQRMIQRGRGAILLTGASASVKGFAQSAPFAMAKFALRGLAQSAARELGPKGIHVAHFLIDGAVRSASRPDSADNTLDPDGIAQAYLDVLRQPRNAWSSEIDLRPWAETF